MKVIDRKATSELINTLIDESGMSRTEIAKMLNVKPQAVFGWKYGRMPNISNLFSLAGVLGVCVSDLLVVDQDAMEMIAKNIATTI